MGVIQRYTIYKAITLSMSRLNVQVIIIANTSYDYEHYTNQINDVADASFRKY